MVVKLVLEMVATPGSAVCLAARWLLDIDGAWNELGTMSIGYRRGKVISALVARFAGIQLNHHTVAGFVDKVRFAGGDITVLRIQFRFP